ncbi:hypothetical protein TNCV_4313441 [Trichonephila clavipes]|nr:hypothetical protein TNCV_4313441 [Trichonephila clavipes]
MYFEKIIAPRQGRLKGWANCTQTQGLNLVTWILTQSEKDSDPDNFIEAQWLSGSGLRFLASRPKSEFRPGEGRHSLSSIQWVDK